MCEEVNAEVVAVAMLEEESCDGNAESISRVYWPFACVLLPNFGYFCQLLPFQDLWMWN